LWFAVLAQAFRDYYGEIPSEGPSRYRKVQVNYCQRTARAWFLSDSAAMGSFRWIADLFELDAQAVRKRLFSGKRIDLNDAVEEPAAETSTAQSSSTIVDRVLDDVPPASIDAVAFAASVPLAVMVAA